MRRWNESRHDAQGGEAERGFAGGFSLVGDGLSAGATAAGAGCWMTGGGVEGWTRTTGAWGAHWVTSVVMAVVSEPKAMARVA